MGIRMRGQICMSNGDKSSQDSTPKTEIPNVSDDYVETFTGQKVWIHQPTPDSLRIEDVAHALSLTCRYAGHTPVLYSVAEHSVLVASVLPPELKLFGLLHDASEAWLVDLPKPVKTLVGEAYECLERNFQDMAYCKFAGRTPTDEESAQVKDADIRVLLSEARVLMLSGGADWQAIRAGYTPADVEVECWEAHKAEAIFKGVYLDLCMKLGVPIAS